MRGKRQEKSGGEGDESQRQDHEGNAWEEWRVGREDDILEKTAP